MAEKSVGLGLRTTITPSATPLLNENAIDRFRQCGVARMAISLDGPDAFGHDGFRRVGGAFARTMFGLDYARRVGLRHTSIRWSPGTTSIGWTRSAAWLVNSAPGCGAYSSWWPPAT